MGSFRFWGLLIGALVAGRTWANECRMKDYGTLPVEMIGPRATTMVKINGADTRFILDTGAFFNMMSLANATALKLDTRPAPYGLRVMGVGGATTVEIATVKEFGIIGTTIPKVDFLVGGSDAGHGLLGANLLDFADLEIDLAGGKLKLFKAEHCENVMLAYWVKEGADYNVAEIKPSRDSGDLRTSVDVMINGKRVRALIDSGAPATVLSSKAARRVGIDLDAPSITMMSTSYGVGGELVKTWVAKVDSLSVGTETIQHSQVQVIEGSFGGSDTDMLLGVDFLLAHRMFIANSTRKIYFTYNGGRVFTLATPPRGSDKSTLDLNAENEASSKKTASEYALQGQAHLSRGEPNAAIANLNAAIGMDPGQAAFYVARARAQIELQQPEAALADLDQSLRIDPEDAQALLLRAQLRLLRDDREGAAADVTAAVALLPPGSNQAQTIAHLYTTLERPADALPILDDWIKLHGKDAMLGAMLNERCRTRALSGQMLDGALRDCRKAIRRDGERPEYLDSLGLIELRLGHYAESIKAYRKAIAGQVRSAWTYYCLGLAEIRNGQTDAGNADLAAALALDPRAEAMAGKFGLTEGMPMK